MKDRTSDCRRIALATIALVVLVGPIAWAMFRSRWRSADEAQRLLRRAAEAAKAEAVNRPAMSETMIAGKTASGRAVEARIGRVIDRSSKTVGYTARLDAPLKNEERLELQLPERGTVVIAPVPSDGTQNWPASDASR